MLSVLRQVLLWLLVLALPVQGLAAPLMLHCGQRAAPEAHAVAHGHADTAKVDHVAEHAGHAGHAGHVGHAADPGDDASASPAGHSCSACAACCAALALPARPALTAHPSPGEWLAAGPVVAVAPYQSDGLERPPRA